MRNVIRTILAGPAHDFTECPNGSLALEQYRLSRPDCVLMDVVMPGIDGLEATRRIKASFPNARIVIVTDHDDTDLRSAAEEAGAEGYVLKEDLSLLRSLCLTRTGASS